MSDLPAEQTLTESPPGSPPGFLEKASSCLRDYRRAFFPALLGLMALFLSGVAVFAIGSAVLATPTDRFTFTQLIGLIVTFVGAALVCYAVTGGHDAAFSQHPERPGTPRRFDDRRMRLVGGQLVLGMGLLVVVLALVLAPRVPTP